MTSPSQPRLTRRDVASQTWPIMLANAAGPLVGIVDAAIIGRLGDPILLAAIGLGTVIYATIYWTFGFLRMSTAGLTAQAVGANSFKEVQAHLARALPLSWLIGGLILIAQIPILALTFKIFPAEFAVEAAAHSYLSTRLWGLPASLGGMALMGWFVGIKRPQHALAMNVWLNLINVALSIWFVVGLNMGIIGVALGSVIAEYVGLMIGLYMARKEVRTHDGIQGGLHEGILSRQIILDRKSLSKLGISNTNIFIRTLAITISFTFFGWQAANQGSDFLASNHILMQFITMMALVLDSYAYVAEATTGAAYGAQSKTRFIRAVRLTSEFALVTVILISVLLFTFGPNFIDLMTTHDGVRLTAKTYLPWCALVPIAGLMAWQLDGIFIGTLKTSVMRNNSVLSLIGYIAAHFTLTPIYGPHGIWMAFLLYYLIRGVTLLIAYPQILKEMTPRSS